jgi:hypothetical protein
MNFMASLRGLGSMALVSVGVLAWAGCAASVHASGGGDVYCDATGCYECAAPGNCTPTSGAGQGSGAQTSSDSGSPDPVVTGVDSGSATVAPDAAPPAQVDAGPPPDCVTTADCVSELPQSCVAGYCRYLCASDRGCEEIDARLDVCGGGDGGPRYCVSSVE